MSDNQSSKQGGIGILGLLGVVFVTLKLCDVIDWPWWQVLAPFWIIPAIAFALLCLALLMGCLSWIFER